MSEAKTNMEAALERALQVQQAKEQADQTGEPVPPTVNDFLQRLFHKED